MRIAHVSDFCLPRLGGIEVHVAGLADHQRRSGHSVDVLTALDGNGGPIARLRPSVIRGLADEVRSGGYDAVHVHAGVFTPLAFAAAAAASRAGIPTVVTAHSLISGVTGPLRALDLVTGWRRLPIAWTAVSRTAAEPIARLMGSDTPVHVLPNAVDADAWRVTRSPRDPDHVVFVAVNRLAARKRPLAFVRALRRARALVPGDVRMSAVIVGDGPQRLALERAIARGGMGDWVHLPGRLAHHEIRALYRRTDVFVAPARLESFGIAALEARAAGLPVVAMARAGVGTFVTHGRDGLLVDDDHELATTLATLTTDTVTRETIAAHNRANTPPFGWSDALARTEIEYARAAVTQGLTVPGRAARTSRLTTADAAA